MSIIKEQKIENKIKAKGILKKISEEGLHIEDEKEGNIELLKFDDLKIFKNRIITISVSDSTKLDIENKEEDN